MQKVRFLGRVVPGGAKLNVFGAQMLWEEGNERGLSAKIWCNIVESTVSIDCEVENLTLGNPISLGKLYEGVFMSVQHIIDIAAFNMASGMLLAIESFVDPSGQSLELKLDNLALQSLCTAFSLSDLSEFLMMASHDPIFLLALNDLNMALAYPGQRLVSCGRAIDGIRHVIAGIGIAQKAGWGAVRIALNVDRLYLQLITDASTRPRHGERNFGVLDQVDEVIKRSWVLMNRLFEYKKRGDQNLTGPDFPQLTG